MPSAVMRWGARPTSSRRPSSKRIRPAVAGWRPVIRLKRVVFPEPLGPMRPTISPSSTRSARSCTARRPPKSFVRPSVSRSDILQGRSRAPALLHRDLLHLLEAGPLHSVEVDHAAGHIALVVYRDVHTEDA